MSVRTFGIGVAVVNEIKQQVLLINCTGYMDTSIAKHAASKRAFITMLSKKQHGTKYVIYDVAKYML